MSSTGGRETPKPQAGDETAEQATKTETPGESGQDGPGEDEDDLTSNTNSESHKRTERSTEPSPSCGWRGVAAAMDVEPGR